MNESISDATFNEIIAEGRKTGHLCFDFNKLSEPQQERLVKILGNESGSFTSVSLMGCDLSVNAIHLISRFLSENEEVRLLNLRGNKKIEYYSVPFLTLIAGKPSANVSKHIDSLHLNGKPTKTESERIMARYITGCYFGNGNVSHVKHNEKRLKAMKTAAYVTNTLDDFGHDYCVYMFVAVISEKRFAGVSSKGTKRIPKDRVITSKKRFSEIALGRVFFEIDKPEDITGKLAQTFFGADAARQKALESAITYCNNYQELLKENRHDVTD